MATTLTMRCFRDRQQSRALLDWTGLDWTGLDCGGVKKTVVKKMQFVVFTRELVMSEL